VLVPSNDNAGPLLYALPTVVIPTPSPVKLPATASEKPDALGIATTLESGSPADTPYAVALILAPSLTTVMY